MQYENKPKEDVLKFVIKVDKSDIQYIFQDKVTSLCKLFLEIANDSLLSLRISGECHVANIIGNVVSDSTIGEHSITFENLEEIYSQKFNKETSVGLNFYLETYRYSQNSSFICALTAKLIEQNEYKKALSLLEPYVYVESPVYPTSEVLYNYFLCLKALKINDKTELVCKSIILQYLRMPMIGDLKNIKLNNNFEQDNQNNSDVV